MLAASGHIAGVINPPASEKYSHWINDNKHPRNPDEWFHSSKEMAGSWWPDWQKWVSKYAGEKVPARKAGSAKFKPIEDAPGSYAKVKG